MKSLKFHLTGVSILMVSLLLVTSDLKGQSNWEIGGRFDVAAAGNFGVEYSFDFPLTLGFDWRPHFMLSDQFRFSGGNWGFIARFRFGEGSKFVRVD